MDAHSLVRTLPALFSVVAMLSTPVAAGDLAADRALFQATRMNDLNAVRTALERGADVNGRSEDGDTPLMYAAVYSTADCITLLLDRKADPNARDKRGGTALMRSVRDIEKVKVLVYGNGVKFLLAAQQADGSWLVRSRSRGTQPYVESGFPYGANQFISAAGTAWATSALLLTLEVTHAVDR
jgi:ankyrin repeat protein